MTAARQVDSTTTVEVADVFRKFGKTYRKTIPISNRQGAVMYSIENCRTAAFGYHVDQCDHCGHIDSDYNSCRDRHCPKCQSISRKKWINDRLNDILPVPYYHVIFTLPHLLHVFLCYNQKLLFELLFSGSSQTLMAFGRDPQWLGGKLGFYGILHTWGQTLWHHPHVHYIVPGGALTKDGQWVSPRYRSKFLFPVRALSKVFRGKFIEGLKNAYYSGQLTIPAQLPHLAKAKSFESWVSQLAARNWVVYCKPPFGSADQVIRYIGRYTHRVAISSRRIEAIDEDIISFRYKDYRKNRKKHRQMRLQASEFIRRFLWHVLPSGFHKIRHYGFLANGCRKTSITVILSLLQKEYTDSRKKPAPESGIECPICNSGKLRTRMITGLFGRRFPTSFIFQMPVVHDSS